MSFKMPPPSFPQGVVPPSFKMPGPSPWISRNAATPEVHPRRAPLPAQPSLPSFSATNARWHAPVKMTAPKARGAVGMSIGGAIQSSFSTPTQALVSQTSAFSDKLSSGRSFMRNSSKFSRPGMLAVIGGAGYLGSQTGDQSPQSFLAGAVGGYIGGASLESASRNIYKGLSGAARNNTGTMASAMKVGKAIFSSGNRNLLFASGALLGGALSGSLFGGSGKTLDKGFNSNKGTRITR